MLDQEKLVDGIIITILGNMHVELAIRAKEKSIKKKMNVNKKRQGILLFLEVFPRLPSKKMGSFQALIKVYANGKDGILAFSYSGCVVI